jgi:tetratricopeptide (TPR) repeat protein
VAASILSMDLIERLAVEGFLASVGLKLLDKVLGSLFEPIHDAYVRLQTRSLIRKSSGRKVSLLLARIDGDNEYGSLRETVRETIRRELGNAVEITLWPEGLRIGDGHEYDAERGAYQKAQNWLAAKHCDLLVWGRLKGPSVLSLGFIVAEVGASHPRTFSLTPDTFDLPTNFIGELGAALTARFVLGVAPAIGMRGQYLVPIMRLMAERLGPLMTRLNSTFDSQTRRSLLHSYALVSATIGEQAGSKSDLEAAISAYHSVLKEVGREDMPLDWATIKNNLGNALYMLGERASGTDSLEQSVEAYREALKEKTRERVPLDWASIQNNLGNALRTLGQRERGTTRLEHSIEAFREALKERTRESVPLDWATTQSNIGTALRTLGERENRADRLEQAVEAHRNALKERTREHVPLHWATAQNNLGNALVSLSERESGAAHLEQAVEAFRNALQERTRERVPLQWAATQNNLGSALLKLGLRENSMRRIEESVAIFAEALEVLGNSEDEYLSEVVRNNLNLALAELHENRLMD